KEVVAVGLDRIGGHHLGPGGGIEVATGPGAALGDGLAVDPGEGAGQIVRTVNPEILVPASDMTTLGLPGQTGFEFGPVGIEAVEGPDLGQDLQARGVNRLLGSQVLVALIGPQALQSLQSGLPEPLDPFQAVSDDGVGVEV